MGAPATLTIEVGPDRDPSTRDRFALSRPEGTFCHLSAWSRAVRRGFHLDTPDLVARRDGRIVGVLPLGFVNSLLFGRRVVSSPFGVYGGPLADGADAEQALLEGAVSLARARRAGHLLLRCRAGSAAGWTEVPGSVTFRGRIARDDAGILESLPRKTRAAVRAGLGEGFVPDDSRERIDDFYRLLAVSYRDHGTPVFPKRWIRALLSEFGEDCVLFSLRDGAGGAVAASVLAFLTGGEVAPYYVGARAADYPRHVNHVLYFELMRWARDRGFDRFDFGRSRVGSGSHAFKRRWGLAETPLPYRVRLLTDREFPDLRPESPRFARRVACWRRLPVWLANRIGPPLSAGLA